LIFLDYLTKTKQIERMKLSLRPYKWNWPSITASDTFPGFQIRATDEPDGTLLTRVLMQIRNAAGQLFYTADSNGLGVQITDAENYEIVFDSFNAPEIAGAYFYDIEIEDDAGTIATIVSGELNVLPQQSIPLPPTPEP
jgi:hypothetical protein